MTPRMSENRDSFVVSLKLNKTETVGPAGAGQPNNER